MSEVRGTSVCLREQGPVQSDGRCEQTHRILVPCLGEHDHVCFIIQSVKSSGAVKETLEGQPRTWSQPPKVPTRIERSLCKGIYVQSFSYHISEDRAIQPPHGGYPSAASHPVVEERDTFSRPRGLHVLPSSRSFRNLD